MTDFILMYHPALGNVRHYFAAQSVALWESLGWVRVDGQTTPPDPETPYLTKAQADSLYAAAGGAGGSLADGAVTPAKLAAKAVTAAKLGDDVPAAIAGSPELRAALGSPDPVLSAFVYDGSGNLTSYAEDGITITLTYNADGTVHTSQRGTSPAKTYSYSGGNLAGVA